MTDKPLPDFRGSLDRLGPVLTSAAMFSVSDVFGKVALNGGADVLSLLAFRSVVGIGLMYAWQAMNAGTARLSPHQTITSLALGVLLAANLFGVFKAIELVPVSIAILTYFVYPLLTGLLGAATGIDRLTLSGAVTALAAFLGLGLIIGASPAGLSTTGVVAALGGALCRAVMLLVTRAKLAGADARRVTTCTLWSSMLLFAAAAAATRTWNWPHGVAPWVAFVGIGLTTTVAIAALYLSTQRIGPFRTALYMNLEPLMTAIVSAVLLGDRLTPLQLLGGAAMIGALVRFQLRR